LAHWGAAAPGGGVESRNLVKTISEATTNVHVSSRAVLDKFVQF